MLWAARLPAYINGLWWSVCPFTGSLLKSKNKYDSATRMPNLVADAKFYCDNPYKVDWTNIPEKLETTTTCINKINKHHQSLLWIGNKNFLLTRLYSSIPNYLVTNSKEAFTFAESIPSQQFMREKLCLQRCMLVAKISKSFKDFGVLFIGANIYSGDMHAWIIENGVQPDHKDRSWVNYYPLMALHK